KSWDGEIIDSDCFDVAFYFNTNTHKIYRATFHPPNDIQIDFIRDFEEGEKYLGNMWLERKINGKLVIYRVWDLTLEIIVDVTDEKLKGCFLKTIHRGKLILSKVDLEDEGKAINLSPKIIVLKCGDATTFDNDDSPLVYFCPIGWNSCSLFVVDTTTMEILSIKLPRQVNNSTTGYWYSVVGVHGGEISVRR
ncbi:hypothetical protein PFISCL1PPCAC_16977, partial [Pristionchus fissidentatus]